MNLDKIKEILEEMKYFRSNMELTLEASDAKVTLRFNKDKQPDVNIESKIKVKEVDNKIYSEDVGLVKYLIKKGGEVEKGDILYKVKPLNKEVTAPYNLKVLDILHPNGGIIQYQTPLLLVEKLN